MRILVVDDSSPHRKLLTAVFTHAGHEVVSAGDGVAALAHLEDGRVDAIVSDVKMPKMDGFQFCRALRQDARWARLPFVFYSSVYIGDPARALGRDLGATEYLDASRITPMEVARALEAMVDRSVRAEYTDTLGRLLGDVEFARRYHQVILAALGPDAGGEVREVVASSAQALDEVSARLDAERQTLSADEARTVEAAQLRLLKELGDFLGDRINNPLAVILASAQLLEQKEPSAAVSEAADRIGTAVRKINAVVREIASRSGGVAPRPPTLPPQAGDPR
jgi:CheY-like chemotaxis protein